jgi:RNA polymerase sigma-70 factor, ECF subfamily
MEEIGGAISMGPTSLPGGRRLDERMPVGDFHSLAELYDQFGSVVFGVAVRVTTDRHAAEDITQAVLLDLWRRPERFDPKRGPLRPWLATVAHHRGVDWMRRQQAVRRRDLDEGRARLVEPAPDIGETVEAVLMAERVRLAVAALPEEERVPIRLAYFGDRTYRQVAEDLNIPEVTIKSRIRAGLLRMANALHSG